MAVQLIVKPSTSWWLDATPNVETYYLYLSDCMKNLHFIRENGDIEIEIRKHYGSSELAVEEENLLITHCIFGALTILLYIPFLKTFIKELKKNSGFDEINKPFLMINLVIFTKVISLALEIAHLVVILKTSRSFDLINVPAQMLNYLSQYLICCLLIFLAAGWTIRFENLKELKVFIPVAIFIGILKLFIMAAGKIMQVDIEFNHRYSSWVGVLLSLFQLGMFAYFATEIVMSLKLATHKKERSFMTNIGVLGAVYFLAFPVTLLIASFIAPHSQNFFVEFMRILSEFATIYYLAFITTNTRGNYKAVAFNHMGGVIL